MAIAAPPWNGDLEIPDMPDFLVRAQPGEGHEKTRRNDSQTRWQAPGCAFHSPAVATKVPVPALRRPLVRSKGAAEPGLGRKGHLMRHYDPARSGSHSQRARLGHLAWARGKIGINIAVPSAVHIQDCMVRNFQAGG